MAKATAFRCMMCGQGTAQMQSRRDAKDGETITIAICNSCGHTQLSPVPTDEELIAFYKSDYRLAYRNARKPKKKHVLRAGRRAKERLDRLQRFLKPGAAHLDIGAGGGEFVYLSGERGLASRGIDPASDYLDFARDAYGIDVTEMGIKDIEADATYDVVTMFHVLEHLPDPAEVFSIIHRLLNDNGMLIVEVPNLDNAQTSPSNFFFKAHLSYFTASTLAALAAPGFDVELMEDRDVLLAVFKKRGDAYDIAGTPFASPQAVQRSQKAFADKGTLQYLLAGGALNGLRKMWRVVDEGINARSEAKSLLDSLAKR